jgi:hypothetical protein
MGVGLRRAIEKKLGPGRFYSRTGTANERVEGHVYTTAARIATETDNMF